MKKTLFLMSCILFGCSMNSISPSGNGLEVDMDLDLSRLDMRHGWAYFSKPATKVHSRDKEAIERGKQLFLGHCQKCHGEKGLGDGPLGKALKLKPANLTKLPREKGKAYLLIQINEGKGSMPQWKDFLGPQQISDLSHFVSDLSR